MIRLSTALPHLGLILAVAVANSAAAGGGPENVLLVVNSGSLDSKTLANHYIALRDVPASNIVYVDWRGGLELAQAKFFSAGVLEPAIEAINNRGLGAQIDYVVYSCDIPWQIELKSLMPEAKFNQYFKPVASVTGVTYLWQFMRDKNPAIVAPDINWYVSPSSGGNLEKCNKLEATESRGFHSRYAWERDGKRTKDRKAGQTYMLSTVLGVTKGRGNTMAQILTYLERAAKADGTQPRGTFYYMQNNNIRSQTRHNCYATAAAEVIRVGSNAVVSQGVLPSGAPDVLGIMTGYDSFGVASSRMKLLPGAICDNLTSYGGDLRAKAHQVPLSDFLRAGAAGASGTVAEPTSMQAKFPLPSLFIHYASGCSLAESYYQSISGPYQQLIVGDPLCQPFAVIPQVSIEGLQAGAEVKGEISFKVNTTVKPPKQVGVVELFLDGRLVARFAPGRSPQLDTTKLPDGYHEFRLVAVNSDPIESRGRLILPLVINNHGRKLELTSTSPTAKATEMIHISAKQAGAKSIVVRQNRREIARFEGGEGEADVLAATLGRGPVILQAESSGERPAFSEPLRLEIR
jgi:uncharacterized protein (TIGR03790 family)